MNVFKTMIQNQTISTAEAEQLKAQLQSEIDALKNKIKYLTMQQNQIDTVIRTRDVNNNKQNIAAKTAFETATSVPKSSSHEHLKQERKKQVSMAQQALKHLKNDRQDGASNQ